MNFTAKYVEVHVFRKKENDLEFLILKRSELESYSGLWQPVTGSVNKNEKGFETALREVKEEINLVPIHFWVVPTVTSFYIYEKDTISLVPVFAAEVDKNAKVQISEEHSEFKWVNFKEAFKRYAWTGQRNSLKTIYEHFHKNSDLNFNEIKITAKL